MPKKRKRRAKSGAASGANAAASSAEEPLDHPFKETFHCELAKQWVRYRETYPVRAGVVHFTEGPRPKRRRDQKAWTMYAQGLHHWLLAEFLVPRQSQPLVGAPSNTALTRVGNKEHYTNIYRVAWLARQHPLVDCVDFHNMKGCKFVCDARGRAIKFHQSQ